MLRGHVEKRGKSKYYTIVFEHGMKVDPVTQRKERDREYIPTDCTDKRAAERYMEDVKYERRSGNYVKPTTLTLGEYLEDWLESVARPNIGDSTYRSYKLFVESHIKPELGHVRLSDLRPMHIQRYISKKLGEGGRKDRGAGGLAARTVLHHHRMLRKALADGVELGQVTRNVALSVRPPREEPPDIHPVPVEEALRIADACDEPFRMVCRTLAMSGVRVSEALGLQWPGDIEPGMIKVNRKVSKEPGGDYTFSPPKRHSKRSIPVPDVLTDELEGMRRASGLVFHSIDDPKKPLHASSVYHHFNRAARRSGHPEGVSLHSLRHGWLSHLLSIGTDPKLVQLIGGHRQIQTLYNNYVHVMPVQHQDLRLKLRCFDGRLDGDENADPKADEEAANEA